MEQTISSQNSYVIPLSKRAEDWTVILKAIWFILLFLLVGFVAFVLVEQGQDMLFAIIDDGQWGSFFFSLAALGMWALQTGFGARVLLMFSDLSFYEDMPKEEVARTKKQSEVDVRVQYRKKIASLLPRQLFFVPYIIMIIGYIRAFSSYSGDNWGMFIGILALLIGSAILIFKLAYSFYEKQINSRHDEKIRRSLRALYQPRKLKELGYIRWMLWLAVGLAAVFILIYCFLPNSALQWLGSVHLITMSFGCWIAILYYVDYLDKKWNVVKLSFSALLIGFSYYNLDHPVRRSEQVSESKPRLNIQEYFDQWYNERFSSKDTTEKTIFFISAEGGACRSGYWTSKVLAKLEDEIPGFSNRIFSYSSVSGGTIGVNSFNAIRQWKKTTASEMPDSSAVDIFYANDFLAPITGRMVFGEIINLFSPRMIAGFDRAGSLERCWEESFDELGKFNPLRLPFNEANQSGPAIFINSTEVETGKRALLSNVAIDSINFLDVINLQHKLDGDVNYSTAMLFSARFPFFSPAAAIQPSADSTRRHYVDGGYFENMGNLTTMEIIRAITRLNRNKDRKIKPVVIVISNDEPIQKISPVRFANEGLEPLSAFMNVRSGHTSLASAQMQSFVKGNYIGGDTIVFNMPLSGKTVPMNWFISENAKTAVKNLLRESWFKAQQDRIRKYMSSN